MMRRMKLKPMPRMGIEESLPQGEVEDHDEMNENTGVREYMINVEIFW